MKKQTDDIAARQAMQRHEIELYELRQELIKSRAKSVDGFYIGIAVGVVIGVVSVLVMA